MLFPRFELSNSDVYKHPLDGAILAQDTCQLFTPSESLPSLSEQDEELIDLQELADQLAEEFQPYNLGQICVSQKGWCQATYLIEAVIYDVNEENRSTTSLIHYTLESALIEVFHLGLSQIAMNPFGTEYNLLSAEEFARMLYKTLEKYQEDTTHLEKIVIAPRRKTELSSLKEALTLHFGDVSSLS